MRRGLPLALVLLAACAGVSPKARSRGTPPPGRVAAVLPFANETVDLQAPDAVRRAVARELELKSYRVLDAGQVDKTLQERFGVSEGGQLGSVDPAALAKALGADALLYGAVSSFGMFNVGFYQNRKVGAALRLLDGRTGAELWTVQEEFAQRALALKKEDAKKAFAKGVLRRQVGKMTDHPMEPECRGFARKALRSLPRPR